MLLYAFFVVHSIKLSNALTALILSMEIPFHIILYSYYSNACYQLVSWLKTVNCPHQQGVWWTTVTSCTQSHNPSSRAFAHFDANQDQFHERRTEAAPCIPSIPNNKKQKEGIMYSGVWETVQNRASFGLCVSSSVLHFSIIVHTQCRLNPRLMLPLRGFPSTAISRWRIMALSLLLPSFRFLLVSTSVRCADGFVLIFRQRKRQDRAEGDYVHYGSDWLGGRLQHCPCQCQKESSGGINVSLKGSTCLCSQYGLFSDNVL